MNRIEIQRTTTDWEASIIDHGRSEFGFIPLPYTLRVSFEAIKRALQEINPQYLIVRV